eukprot:19662_6
MVQMRKTATRRPFGVSSRTSRRTSRSNCIACTVPKIPPTRGGASLSFSIRPFVIAPTSSAMVSLSSAGVLLIKLFIVHTISLEEASRKGSAVVEPSAFRWYRKVRPFNWPKALTVVCRAPAAWMANTRGKTVPTATIPMEAFQERFNIAGALMKVAIKVRRIMSHVRIDKSENAAPSKIFMKKWGSSTCGKRSSNQVGSRLAAMYFRSSDGGMALHTRVS